MNGQSQGVLSEKARGTMWLRVTKASGHKHLASAALQAVNTALVENWEVIISGAVTYHKPWIP